MRTVAIETADQWHALRARHIGGSEAAALFDLSPYITRFMLWHAKAGAAPLPEPHNSRVDWGELLEPAIAKGVAAEMRWRLEQRKVYCIADGEWPAGMGCTLDYEIVDHADGPGFCEIKNVDWREWRDKWTDAGAPPHIEIQVQHQFAVTGYAWGCIAVLVGGNELKIYERRPHVDTICRLSTAIADFWRSIERADAPDPFGAAPELDTLRALYNPPDPDTVTDLTGDAAAFEIAREYAWAREQEAFHRKIKEVRQVALLAKLGKGQRIVLPGFDIRRRKDGPIHKCEMLEGAQPPALGDLNCFL